MTVQLQQHEHVQETRELVATNIATDGPLHGRNDYKLGGVEGVPKYVRDYSTLLTGGLTGNLAVTYLGSYGLKYDVTSIDPKARTASVTFTAWNASTISSATHPPVIGYTSAWNRFIGKPLDNAFKSGPLSRTTQTFVWTESIKW